MDKAAEANVPVPGSAMPTKDLVAWIRTLTGMLTLYASELVYRTTGKRATPTGEVDYVEGRDYAGS